MGITKLQLPAELLVDDCELESATEMHVEEKHLVTPKSEADSKSTEPNS